MSFPEVTLNSIDESSLPPAPTPPTAYHHHQQHLPNAMFPPDIQTLQPSLQQHSTTLLQHPQQQQQQHQQRQRRQQQQQHQSQLHHHHHHHHHHLQQQSLPPIRSLPEPAHHHHQHHHEHHQHHQHQQHQQHHEHHQHHHTHVQPQTHSFVSVTSTHHPYPPVASVAPPQPQTQQQGPSHPNSIPQPMYPPHIVQPTPPPPHTQPQQSQQQRPTIPSHPPPPPPPPSIQPDPQYPSHSILPNPASAIQTHPNSVPNHPALSTVYSPTQLQQKPDVLLMNVFQPPVDTVTIAQSPPPPHPPPHCSSLPLHPIATHPSVPLPGISIPEMVVTSPVAPPPISISIPASSEMFDSFLAVGRACRSIGRYDLAADAFRACMAICPDSSEASMSYQQSCRWNGIDCRSTIDMSHVFPEDMFNDIGNELRYERRIQEAEMAYRAALNIAPRHAQAWNNLGNAMRARSAFMDAMSCYSASLTCQPGFAAAHCNLAGLLRDQGKPQDAETQYRAALASDPNLAEAAAGLGTALRDMGRTDEAVAFYVRSVALQPDAADHHANLANTYKDLNRIEESIVSYQAALSLQPDMPDAFCNMVHSLSVICDWSNRSQNFVTLLNIIDKQLDTLLRIPSTTPRLYSTIVGALSNSTPQLVDACGGSRSDRDSASFSTVGGKEENSMDVFHHRRRYVHHPSSPTVVRRARKTTKFSKFLINSSSVDKPVLTSGLPSVQPFHALIYPMSPEKFKALSAAYASRAESMVAGIPCVNQRWTVPRGPRARLKVGYVSSDYNNHPYSHLTQSIYGLHGTGISVECFCYALTPSDQSTWRLRIERESENFRDISGLTAKQSAEAIANDGIHVLVNCNGYTKGARTELFALRPAPVQVSFMGFPGTLGAHFIEYFITDVVTSPPELASRMHSESLLYHPHSYFVNDHRQTSIPGPRAYPSGELTRAHYNLPEDCFLFIMHNQLYKLSPDTFDVWARILKRVPDSKIWLLRFPPSGEQRIRQEALSRGLGPDRLIFTDVAGKEEHVARAGLGDLFLDTPTCNGHTTGTDVLWSGCPMITCPGSLFASRVAASLLTAAGVPELIAPDMNAYEDLAVELATNQAKLARIRAKIEASRYSNALFDTERWVRNVERLYWQAWKNFDDGNRPRHIYGKDVYEEVGMNTLVGMQPFNTAVANGITAIDSNNYVNNNGISNNNHSSLNNSNNSNGYSGTESWHSESPFYGRVFNSTVVT